MKVEVTLDIEQIKEAIQAYVKQNLPGMSEYEISQWTFYRQAERINAVEVEALCVQLEKD